MSTPAMLFMQYTKWLLVGFWSVWLTTLVVSRVFIFHEAYTSHLAKIVDEMWLTQQCNTPEFYSNIRQHTDLCETVYATSRSNAFLVALNAMAVNTYACGTASCTEVLKSIFVTLGWQTAAVVVILFIFAPNMLVFIYKILSSRSTLTDESMIFRKNERHTGEQSPYFQDLQSYQHPYKNEPEKRVGYNVVKMV
jgi:hypothetical protein